MVAWKRRNMWQEPTRERNLLGVLCLAAFLQVACGAALGWEGRPVNAVCSKRDQGTALAHWHVDVQLVAECLQQMSKSSVGEFTWACLQNLQMPQTHLIWP